MSNDPRTDSSAPSPVAVVTGASQGLGRALAAALAERGWHLVVDARRPTASPTPSTDLRRRARHRRWSGDVTEPDHRAALVGCRPPASGPVRLLVNNASTLGASPLPALDAITPDVLGAPST